MAEAIVTFVVERLGDLLTKEAQLLYGVHQFPSSLAIHARPLAALFAVLVLHQDIEYLFYQ